MRPWPIQRCLPQINESRKMPNVPQKGITIVTRRESGEPAESDRIEMGVEQEDRGQVPLTKEQVSALQEIFTRFDKDGDGSLTELEMAALLRSLGLSPDGAQLQALFERVDGNSNGLIEFSEFVELVGPEMMTSPVSYNDEELASLFRAFDRDGNGFITAAELAHSMARLGHRLSARELADMMAEADADGDGRISFDEFAKALTGRSSGADL